MNKCSIWCLLDKEDSVGVVGTLFVGSASHHVPEHKNIKRKYIFN